MKTQIQVVRNNFRRLLTLAGVLIHCLAFSQEDLTTHRGFFQGQIQHLKTWITNEGLSEFISINEEQAFDVSEDSLIILFDMKSLNTWQTLDSAISLESKQALSRRIFYNVHYLFDTPLSQTYILIDATDGYVRIWNEDGQVRTMLSKKMAVPTVSIKIPIDEISLTAYGINMTTSKTIELVKANIKDGLYEFFIQYEATSWFTNFEVKDLSLEDNHLTLKYKYMSGVVLVDKGYWEIVDLHFTFSQVDELLAIDYTLSAEYAGGSEYLWQPYEERYRPVETVSKSQWDEFKAIIHNVIKNQLNE